MEILYLMYWLFAVVLGASIEIINYLNGHPFGLGMIFYWVIALFTITLFRRTK